MGSRVLVIMLGWLRAHEVTWHNFKTNVLDELEADLAVCVQDDKYFDFTNPFLVNAKFRWVAPAASDIGDIYDKIHRRMGSEEDWRILCEVKGTWLGGIVQSDQATYASLELALRWFIVDNVIASGLTTVYDRFVITRSDFYYLCPHPPLDCLYKNYIWIPDGEDYGGICPRHLVVSADDIINSINMLNDFLMHPRELFSAMSWKSDWNIEQVIALYYTRKQLMSKVKRFPYVMFLVRSHADPIPSHGGHGGNYDEQLFAFVKYKQERDEAERHKGLLRCKDDWRLMFAVQNYFPTLLPLRIYTMHGTVLYVDEETLELRHGHIDEVPRNIVFVIGNSGGRLIHVSHEESFDILYLQERSQSFAPLLDTVSQEPIVFDIVHIQPGFQLNQTLMTNNLVGLRNKGTYLCAEPDGRVVLNRPHCYKFEHFRVLPDLHDETGYRSRAGRKASLF